jgi:hypothetical protein
MTENLSTSVTHALHPAGRAHALHPAGQAYAGWRGERTFEYVGPGDDNGVDSRGKMAQTGPKSETVVRDYIQDAGLGATAAVKAAFRED